MKPNDRWLGGRARDPAWLAQARSLAEARYADPRSRPFREWAAGRTLVVIDAVEGDEIEAELASLSEDNFVVVLTDWADEALRNDPRVDYLARPGLTAEALACIAVGGWPRERFRIEALDGLDVARVQAALELVRRLALAGGLGAAASMLQSGFLELLGADRVHCLFHDDEADKLWAVAPVERELRPSAGLVGFVARTGAGLAVERAGDDARACLAVDDPDGDADAHLLIAPVLGAKLGVDAVIVVARETKRPCFDDDERLLLELVCGRAWSMLAHVRELERTEQRARDYELSMSKLSRADVLRQQAEGIDHGQVVRTLPRWTRGGYWLVLALVLAGALFLVFGRISLYSTGPAVVRLNERAEVVAPASGALVELGVEAGARVEAGTVLARLDDGHERAELERLEQTFEQGLRARLLAPQDDATIAPLAEARRQLDDARAAAAEREVRSPWAGTVSDLRMRPGQHIATGQVLMSVLRDVEDPRVLALMPGADSPRIEAGMAMRIELPNYNRAYQELIVERVGQEVVGPSEAQRFLGPASADSVVLGGPVVLVEARLPKPEFEVDGVRYHYREGMEARAEIRVRSASLLELLIPGLRGVVPGG